MSIILSSTTDRIEVVSGSAAVLDFVTQWVEADKSTAPAIVDNADTKVGSISSATTTDVSGSPPTANKRWAVTTSVTNVDPSDSNDITLQYVKAGGAPNVLINARLYAGWSLRLDAEGEVSVFDELGVLQVNAGVTDAELRASPIDVSGPLTDTELRATPVPISATALPLPAGAATNLALSALGSVLVAIEAAVEALPTAQALTDAELRANPVPVSGPLTDAQLRAVPVPVSGPLTDAALRAAPVPVSGPLTDAALRASDVGVDTGLAQPLTNTELRAAPVPVSGPATDAQLRAAPLPVSGPLTDVQLRASAVPVDTGLAQSVTDTQLRAAPVPVSGPATDAQLRATPLPVSGPLTDTELRAAPVPVSGSVTTGPSKGVLVDCSGSIDTGDTSQQVVVANVNRKYFLFVNVSDTDMWINLGADANTDQPSILVKANGGSFVMEASYVSTEAVNVICAVTGKSFTAKEA